MWLPIDYASRSNMFNNLEAPPPSRFVLKSQPELLPFIDNPGFAQLLYHHFGRSLERGQYLGFNGAMSNSGFEGGWSGLHLRPGLASGVFDDDWFQTVAQESVSVSVSPFALSASDCPDHLSTKLY